MPAELAELHEKYSGEAGRLWIAGLPAMAVSSMDRWQLVDRRPGCLWRCCADHSGCSGAMVRRPCSSCSRLMTRPAVSRLRCRRGRGGSSAAAGA